MLEVGLKMSNSQYSEFQILEVDLVTADGAFFCHQDLSQLNLSERKHTREEERNYSSTVTCHKHALFWLRLLAYFKQFFYMIWGFRVDLHQRFKVG